MATMADRHSTNSKAIMLRLPPDLEKALRGYAKKDDRSMASVIRKALRLYLNVEKPDWEDADRDAVHDDRVETILEVLHPK